MAERVVLRDRWGKAIGQIEDKGVVMVLRDRWGKELGRYDKKKDITMNRWGKIIGRGNLLPVLLGTGDNLQ